MFWKMLMMQISVSHVFWWFLNNFVFTPESIFVCLYLLLWPKTLGVIASHWILQILQIRWDLQDGTFGNTVHRCRLPPVCRFAGGAKGDISRCPQLECAHWNSKRIILLRLWGKGFTDLLSQLEQTFNEWLSGNISDKVHYVYFVFPLCPIGGAIWEVHIGKIDGFIWTG